MNFFHKKLYLLIKLILTHPKQTFSVIQTCVKVFPNLGRTFGTHFLVWRSTPSGILFSILSAVAKCHLSIVSFKYGNRKSYRTCIVNTVSEVCFCIVHHQKVRCEQKHNLQLMQSPYSLIVIFFIKNLIRLFSCSTSSLWLEICYNWHIQYCEAIFFVKLLHANGAYL